MVIENAVYAGCHGTSREIQGLSFFAVKSYVLHKNKATAEQSAFRKHNGSERKEMLTCNRASISRQVQG